MKKWIAVLRLSRLSIPGLIELARFIVKSMTGNTYFPDPWIALAAITAAAKELEDAYVASRDAGKDETALMYSKQFQLEILLLAESHYVEYTANTDNDIGDAIIFSAGMNVKQGPGSLARTFEVRNTELDGRVLLRTKSERTASYKWQYTTTPSDENSWVDAGDTLQATTVVTGLTSGQRYYFRVQVTTRTGSGPWQGPINIIVT